MKKDYIYLKGENKTRNIISYKLNGQHYIIRFNNGREYTYKKKDVEIVKKEIISSKLDYLLNVANLLPSNNDDSKYNSNDNFLLKQLKNISESPISPVLKSYFTGKINKGTIPSNGIIYPFGANLSQLKSIKMALSNQISIIEGPPGTGKTQTILNIISNVILQKKTIAVVSGNNSATRNVEDKFIKKGYGDIVAMLGNRENRNLYFNKKHTTISRNIENVKLDNYFREGTEELESLFSIDNKLSQLKKELYKLKVQKNNFIDNREFVDKFKLETLFSKKNYKSEEWSFLNDCCDSWKNIDKYTDSKRILARTSDLFIYFKILLKFKINLYKKSQAFINSLSDFASIKFYEYKLIELESEKAELLKLSSDLNPLLNRQVKNSNRILNNFLKKNILHKDLQITDKNLLLKFKEFIKQVPVILSTTNSIRNTVPYNFVFDYLIIDEASQVDLVTATIALSCCKNIVIVGDDKQLPHIVTSELSDDIIKNNLKRNDIYDYIDNSILTSIKKIQEIPRVTLLEHYRCHPLIIDFCNQHFYGGQLIIKSNWETENPFNIYTTDRKNILCQTRKNGKLCNYAQQDKIKDIISHILENDDNVEKTKDEIGVIAPFRDYVNTLQKRLYSITIDTIHKFQGREKNQIIFSTVSEAIDDNDFANNSNLLNVAVSRAINKFTLVCGYNRFEKIDNKTNIGALLGYMKTNGGSIIFHSIFDYLYNNNLTELRKDYLNCKYGSKFASENLINEMLTKDILKNKNEFYFLVNYPLKNFINKKLSFNQEEKLFISRSSHIDFLIYNKLDATPRLAIEVNGQQHKEKLQSNRDRIKKNILKKCNIELLNLDTCGSNERQQIMDILFN